MVAAPAHSVMLAAAALCGADEVYRIGGAQAIAALALGTETVRAVDVIAGPGNLYVQEAKRQLSGHVGIDGFAGPSDLLVLASAGADPHLLALDLLAQAEHGDDSLVAAVAGDAALLDAIGGELQALAGGRPSIAAGPKLLVDATDLDAALAFSEALAPEHLQLAGAAAEALAPRVRRAGCVFVGVASATAFGDYVAGSNHTLPTDGAARFASGLNVGHFRRRMAEVHVRGAAAELARAAVPVAAAEGFAVHAESMSARIRENR
jgi:histidinol dehydrogenase